MQRPTGSSHPSIVLAVVTTAGGVQGFVKQKSKASLIAGLTLGAAFAGSAALIDVRFRRGANFGRGRAASADASWGAAADPRRERGADSGLGRRGDCGDDHAPEASRDPRSALSDALEPLRSRFHSCVSLSSAQSGKHVEGHTVSLAASFVMLGAMAPRFIRSKKIWPAGVCTVLGGANVPYQYFKTRQWMDA